MTDERTTTSEVFLVAIALEGDARTREQWQAELLERLPAPGVIAPHHSELTWWIAEDDRRDGSDCDSAVFCAPGHQRDARAWLARLGHATETADMGVGARIVCTSETGIVEHGVVFGMPRRQGDESQMLTVHFDDDTFLTVPARWCRPEDVPV